MEFKPSTHQNSNEDIHLALKLRRESVNAREFCLEINTVIPASGITAIFGHSGSGKTTLLRCIAGLEKSTGTLKVSGSTWQDNSSFLPSHKRPVGYVFQEASLFPHLSAQGNLDFSIKRAPLANKPIKYDQIIDTLGIGHLLSRRPDQLSGGERQRVAIARALLIQPKLLLMDEPLAALDPARKQEIMPYLEQLHSSVDIPFIYVSHSIDEIARLADHALLLNQGRIETQGSTTDVFSDFASSALLGDETGVILQARITKHDDRWKLSQVEIGGNALWLHSANEAIGVSVRVRVLARDVSISLSETEQSSILNRIPVIVDSIQSDKQKSASLVRLKSGKQYLFARLTEKSAHILKLAPGKKVWAQIKSVAIVR